MLIFDINRIERHPGLTPLGLLDINKPLPRHDVLTTPASMKEETPGTTIEKPQATSKEKSGEAHRSLPASLKRLVSPPRINPRRRLKSSATTDSLLPTATSKSESAKVEAGEVDISDHVAFFSSKLLAATRQPLEGYPRVSHSSWLDLYHRNLDDRGHHFVVHQHDHPIAGTHYDLRLQCNASSSISFALPYGLPGDPNSRRLNRYAIETRVHNLWNHLIETASYETGTMLLWETGEYEVIPYESSSKSRHTDYATASEGSGTDSKEGVSIKESTPSESQKLHHAFQRRKIKLRLNGTRLPKNYTVSIRLMEDNNRIAQPDAPAFKRRRTNNSSSSTTPRRKSRPEEIETFLDSSRRSSPTLAAKGTAKPDSPASESEVPARTPSPTGISFNSLDHSLKTRKSSPRLKRCISSLLRTASPPPPRRSSSITQSQVQSQQRSPVPRSNSIAQSQIHSQSQELLPSTRIRSSPPNTTTPTLQHLDDSTTEAPQDITMRQTNAYPGALNTINSIHQRKWFLSLDRAACGFRPTSEFAFGRRVWERPLLHPRDRDAEGERTWKEELRGGFAAFHVLGRDVETSILTGRLAGDVARDEGLVGYRPRGGWKGITD